MSSIQSPKLSIMVSSTVYGSEDVLDRIFDMLTSFGYEVWMSHKGTLPVSSHRSAFENCLEGVRRASIFLGIIGTRYGSGTDSTNPRSLSIAHQELRLAIELNKPRWLLAHENILTARTLLSKLEDLRLIDMYEEAIFDRLPLSERAGNWVQKIHSGDDAGRFVLSQFFRQQEVLAFVEEHFSCGNPHQEGQAKR
jgi:hypothetical protein